MLTSQFCLFFRIKQKVPLLPVFGGGGGGLEMVNSGPEISTTHNFNSVDIFPVILSLFPVQYLHSV